MIKPDFVPTIQIPTTLVFNLVCSSVYKTIPQEVTGSFSLTIVKIFLLQVVVSNNSIAPELQPIITTFNISL